MRLTLGCTQIPARTTARDKLELEKQAPFPLKDIHPYHYRGQSTAQKIRDMAGVPAGIETGIQSGVTPGLTNAGALSMGSKLQIANESNVQNIAASGAGTANDPYIVQDLDYNGLGLQNWALRFNDPDANYHVIFTNCRFRNWTAQNIWFDTWGAGSITFQQCDFFNTSSNAELFLHEQGTITLDACTLSGCDSFAGYLVSASATGSLTLTNIKITDDNGSWANSGDVFYINSADLSVSASYIEVEDGMTSTGAESVFQLLACTDGASFTNLKMNGGFDHMLCDNDTDTTQKEITIAYFDLRNSQREAIQLSSLKNSAIRYGHAAHDSSTGSGYRLIYLISSDSNDAVRIEDTVVEYVSFTKQSGSGANNECLETARAKNTVFRYCYVTECTEDAFEHIAVISGCTIEYCVADNCTGQVADFFKQWDEGTWSLVTDTSNADDSQSYCHHIYGECSDYALIATALKGLYFHDIHVDNTDSADHVAVRIEDIDDITIRDIYGAGALPLQTQRGDGSTTAAVTISGGAGIKVNFSDTVEATGNLTSL